MRQNNFKKVRRGRNEEASESGMGKGNQRGSGVARALPIDPTVVSMK